MLCLALTAALLLFLAACGNSPKQAIEAPTVPQNQDASTTEPEVTQGNAASESSHHFLIAYFTAAENSDVDAVSSSSVVTVDGAPKGRVQALAEIIQRDTGGDLFSIRTSTVYPGDGSKLEDFAAEEQNAKARPELTTHIENLDAYDVIFVGYPAVCQAVIVVDISGLFADISLTVETAAAVGTEYFPLKDIGGVLADYPLLALLCGFLQNVLDCFKQFVADNGFMGAVDNRPLHFTGFDLLVVYNFCAALYQITRVNLRMKDSCNRARVPVPIAHQVFVGNNTLGVLVVAGGKIPRFIQTNRNRVQTGTFRCPLKDLPYHRSGNRVDD